jgi:hypothetical protein
MVWTGKQRVVPQLAVDATRITQKQANSMLIRLAFMRSSYQSRKFLQDYCVFPVIEPHGLYMRH